MQHRRLHRGAVEPDLLARCRHGPVCPGRLGLQPLRVQQLKKVAARAEAKHCSRERLLQGPWLQSARRGRLLHFCRLCVGGGWPARPLPQYEPHEHH